MKKLFLVGVLFAGKGWCQLFGLPSIVFDPTNHGVNAANLVQMQQLYSMFTQYQQFFKTAQGMYGCPSCFLSTGQNALGAITNMMIEDGHWDASNPETQRRLASMQKLMNLGQMAMQQASSASAMSTGNGANTAALILQMGQMATQMSDTQKQIVQAARSRYYSQLNTYHPQGDAIRAWRLK